MFGVVRTVNETIESVKDLDSQSDKIFHDSIAAELQAKKLNLDLILADLHYWRVEPIEWD